MTSSFRRATALVGIVLPLALVAVALAQPGGSTSVVKTSATLEKSAAGKDVVVVRFAVEKPWHIYANPVGNEGQETSRTTIDIVGKTKPNSVQVEYPRGSDYEEFGEKLKVYEGAFEIRAIVEREPGDKGPLEAVVRFGACKEKECLPRAIVRIPLP
jgi:uncharacterized protein